MNLTTTTCSSDTTGTVWKTWVSDTTTSANVTTNLVWDTWCADYNTSTSFNTCDAWKGWVYVPTLDEATKSPAIIIDPNFEQSRQERLRVEREERERLIKIQAEQKRIAEDNAISLLERLIGREQTAIYKKTGNLFVKGDKDSYIIRKEGRVIKFNEKEMCELCVHLENRNGFPNTDNVVALKLALEAMEDHVVKMANVFRKQELRLDQIPQAACSPLLN
jgi:hypothetical protein